MSWATITIFVAESVIIALAVLPAATFWSWHFAWTGMPPWLRVFVLALAFVPAYLIFAAGVMLHSAVLTRILGWRTPPNLDVRLRDFDWAVLAWARFLVTIHVVRLFAGVVFRSTPVWVWYMRLNGARIDRGVWINSLSLMDHNLLELGKGCVIGSDAHVSAHTVQRGRLMTAPVRLGKGVTVGIGSVVEIGVEAGDGAQIGALSVVPKFMRLDAATAYAGSPVHPLGTPTIPTPVASRGGVHLVDA